MNLFSTTRWRRLRRTCRALPESFGRGLGALGRIRNKSSEPAWGATVEQVIAELENLNQVTERDFLSVGGKLMEFLTSARQISSDMAALTELISGERGRDASRALTRMMERSRQMGARMEQSGQALASIRSLSRRIQLAFLKLQETVAVIRTLCTLTRIETSRLGADGTDFGDLADEVNPLSAIIQSSGQGVLEASARLDQGVQVALEKGSDLSAVQLKELHSLMASVVESLQAFEERRERAQEASGRQSAQHREVCGAIEDLVESVQFHDITRQQIEHISQALRQLRSEADNHGEDRSPPPEARTVLTLQSSHLSSAGLAFAASMERMERDLENIAARAREMAEASGTLMGFSGDEKDSFFLRMEGLFTGILKAVGACGGAESAMGATASELGGTIASMQESIEEIRGVEIHIQRIAINATIRSAHIGAAGNGLNVIADVMHRVALDSNQNTEEVAAALASMSDAAGRVSAGSAATLSGGPPDTDEVLEQMRGAILQLHASSESSFSRVSQIAALGARLGDDISAVRGSLSAGPFFAAVVSRTRGELQRIEARSQAGPYAVLDLARPEDLERFRKRYTMQTEHDVHEALVGGAPTPADKPAGESRLEVDAGSLGNNVELF